MNQVLVGGLRWNKAGIAALGLLKADTSDLLIGAAGALMLGT